MGLGGGRAPDWRRVRERGGVHARGGRRSGACGYARDDIAARTGYASAITRGDDIAARTGQVPALTRQDDVAADAGYASAITRRMTLRWARAVASRTTASSSSRSSSAASTVITSGSALAAARRMTSRTSC